MPLPAGLEGFPFTTFQAELEAFTVKLRAEQEAPVPKAKVKEVKAKVKKAKAKEAKPEVEAKSKEVKAKVELRTLTKEEEEALIKFVALLEKEEDFLDAKAEAEKEAEKCGSKRKVELERDEEGAAFLAWIESTKPPTDQVDYSDGDVSDGYHSQDDAIGSDGRVMSRYERRVQANNARWPFLVGA
ncbi:uncharacterized protein [Triticum aestivum]|uniref:uncharacterized protein n=1 Tax=Triticum aestivum TaxID=4565 RepID=UPI001D0292BF|nr:uncharacterized protein LOC123158560 [Triticum aestivum]